VFWQPNPENVLFFFKGIALKTKLFKMCHFLESFLKEYINIPMYKIHIIHTERTVYLAVSEYKI
jgi:hypothetical protein